MHKNDPGIETPPPRRKRKEAGSRYKYEQATPESPVCQYTSSPSSCRNQLPIFPPSSHLPIFPPTFLYFTKMGLVNEILKAAEDANHRRNHFSPVNYFQTTDTSSFPASPSSPRKKTVAFKEVLPSPLPTTPIKVHQQRKQQQPVQLHQTIKTQPEMIQRTSSTPFLRSLHRLQPLPLPEPQQHIPLEHIPLEQNLTENLGGSPLLGYNLRFNSQRWMSRLVVATILVTTLSYLAFYMTSDGSESTLRRQHMDARKQRQKQIDRLGGMAEDLARRWVGKAFCGEVSVPSWVQAEDGTILGMPLAFAREELSRSFDEGGEGFSDLWGMFVIQLVHGDGGGKDWRGTLTTALDGSLRHRLILSSAAPIVSLSCKIRGYWRMLLAIAVSPCLGLILRQRYLAELERSRIVSALVEDAQKAVYDATEAHARDPVHHPVPGLSIGQLRDHFLPVVISGRPKGEGKDQAGRKVWYLADETARKAIWTQVEQVISRNSNVRETSMEMKGELHRTYMWVGGLSPGNRL